MAKWKDHKQSFKQKPNKIHYTCKLMNTQKLLSSLTMIAPLIGGTSHYCALHRTQPRLGRPEVATTAAIIAIQEQAYEQGISKRGISKRHLTRRFSHTLLPSCFSR